MLQLAASQLEPSYRFYWRLIAAHTPEFPSLPVAAIVRGEDNAFDVIRVLSDRELKAHLDDNFARQLIEYIPLLILAAKAHFHENALEGEWPSPLDGFSLSEVRESSSHNIEEAILQTLRQIEIG